MKHCSTVACLTIPVILPLFYKCYIYVCMYVCDYSRGESAGGDRERSDAAGPKWSGEGLPPDQPETHPTDGCPGGTQCSGHYIG